jgi:hypothetical protein
MNKKTGLILILVVILTLGGILGIVWPFAKKQIKRDAAIGMVSAVRAALEAELQENESPIRQRFGNINDEMVFNEKQYDAAILELAKGYNLDPPGPWDPTTPLLDPWGNRLVIWIRKLPYGKYQSQVTSQGKDCIFGTEDDISYGERTTDH